MKYVVLRVVDRSAGQEPLAREMPIIFPEAMTHKLVADFLTAALHREPDAKALRQVTCVSAGFLSSTEINAEGERMCHGKSESLGIRSRGEVDDRLMHMMDYTHGIEGAFLPPIPKRPK